MKKYKITDEQRTEIKKRALTMPVFPKTDKNGKPLIFAKWFTGKELKVYKHLKNVKLTDAQKKALNDNQRYGPFYVLEDRDPFKYLLGGLPNGEMGLADAYKKYMREYNLYQKLMVSNNTKLIQDKNINNEKNQTTLPGPSLGTDPIDGTNPGPSSPGEGHSEHLDDAIE